MQSPSEIPVKAFGPKLRLIERLGQACLTVWIVVLVVFGIVLGHPYDQVWQLVLGQVAMGRAMSISTGLNLGFSRWFLLFQCSVQDILVLLLLYPFIVAGYRRAVEMSFIGQTVVNIRATAERHKEWVRRWGVLGLIAFVLFPLWSTGALAGGVLGYLIGMEMWVTFSSVIIGNFIAVALWIYFFNWMSRLSGPLFTFVPLIILAVAVLAAVIARQRKHRKSAPVPDAKTSENHAETASPGEGSGEEARLSATQSACVGGTSEQEKPSDSTGAATGLSPGQ